MEKARTFPIAGVELRYLLVASDYAHSLTFYRDVLGAREVREISDVLCCSVPIVPTQPGQ